MAATVALLLALAVAAAAASEEIHSGPSDVVWAVQLSDLHVSVYHPARAQELELLAARALALVRPHLVLITGDLTDAKNRELTVTRQDEAEWVQYRRSMQLVVERSGLPKRAFFDLRGNHDKFGVPDVNGELDYFSRFSISAEMNRTDLVQAAIVTAGGGSRYLFLGFDDTASVGLRGPTNLFGQPTDGMLERIGEELGKHRAPTVVFGHFPMSFTTATESGKRLEDILSRHSVLAYVCGHLHTKFGQQLYRFHSPPSSSSSSDGGGFWEWEMGDWRGQRAMRILALDQGLASFADFSLRANHTAFIVQTHPLDSRFMTKTGRSAAVGGSVRALVFSDAPVAEVVASVYDSQPGSQILAEELVMQPESSSSVLYQASWIPSKYSGSSPLRYWIEIRVTDTLGRQARSQLRPFSGNGSNAPWRLGLWGFLVMGVQWDAVYPILFWLSIGLLAALLVLPKLLATQDHLEESAAWSTAKLPLWILAEGSRNAGLWWAQVVYLAYLLLFPWFWGRPSAETYPSGYMTYRGWRFQGQLLATTDVLVIVLPFCYLVLLPLAALISLLSAERALVRSHTCPAPTDKQVGGRPGLLHLLDQKQQQQQQCRVCSRWMRKLLLLACAAVALLHWRQCYLVAAAYGPMAVLASPAFAWWPPLVMVFGVYETRSVGRRRRGAE